MCGKQLPLPTPVALPLDDVTVDAAVFANVEGLEDLDLGDDAANDED